MLLRQIRAGWIPNLRRLEELDPEVDLCLEDYAESWGWVHFLLNTNPQLGDLCRAYLSELRRDGSAEPLSLRLERMLGDPGRQMARHMLNMSRPLPPTAVRSAFLE